MTTETLVPLDDALKSAMNCAYEFRGAREQWTTVFTGVLKQHGYTIAALSAAAPAQAAPAAGEDWRTRFWQIVDGRGLLGLPSDEWNALSRLVNSYAERAAPAAGDVERIYADADKALSAFADWWEEGDADNEQCSRYELARDAFLWGYAAPVPPHDAPAVAEERDLLQRTIVALTEANVAKSRENDRLRESLESIARLTAPGSRTMDELMRDMGYACDRARAAQREPLEKPTDTKRGT